MSGITAFVSAIAGGAGGGGGGGGPSALSAVIGGGDASSDWNNPAWVWSTNTCVASGGVPPYTYQWVWSDDTGGTFNFTGSSTAVSVNPSVSGVTTIAQGTLTCTVTDSDGVPNVATSGAAMYFYENIFV